VALGRDGWGQEYTIPDGRQLNSCRAPGAFAEGQRAARPEPAEAPLADSTLALAAGRGGR
jgi:hypothetical protein